VGSLRCVDLSGCRIETAVASSTPFPVKHITFDVKELPFEGQRLAYLVLTSTLQKAGLPTSQVWQKVSDRIEVKVESWMLPGHAVTISADRDDGQGLEDEVLHRRGRGSGGELGLGRVMTVLILGRRPTPRPTRWWPS
jgi:hypothetical protein